MGRKKGSIKPLGQPSPEEMARARMMWRKYLARRAKRKVKFEAAKLVGRHRKTSKTAQEETESILKEIRSSEVFLESPTSVDGRMPITNLNCENFWDYVYQHKWKGRIRVCEGELMYKITETFKKLVSMKMIANFNVTSLFATENSENEFGEDEIPVKKVRKIRLFWSSTTLGIGADSARPPPPPPPPTPTPLLKN